MRWTNDKQNLIALVEMSPCLLCIFFNFLLNQIYCMSNREHAKMDMRVFFGDFIFLSLLHFVCVCVCVCFRLNDGVIWNSVAVFSLTQLISILSSRQGWTNQKLAWFSICIVTLDLMYDMAHIYYHYTITTFEEACETKIERERESSYPNLQLNLV